MKKSISLVLVIIAAMVAFAGCVKQEADAPATAETKTVQFVAESIETKTTFGTPDGTTYPTLWTANDKKVQLLLNLNEEFVADINSVADDFTSASFSADVKIKDDGSEAPYQFCAISPSTAYLGKNDVRFAVTIPTSQTPLENSVDEKAQILYALSGSYDELPETVELNFKHFTAYGKLSFKNLDLGDANVISVAITSSVDFANRWNCFIADESFGENSGASTITLNTSATENLWFACAPVGAMNGNTLTFTINTDKGPLSKTVTLGEKHKFESGKIAKMTVDMSGVTFEESKVYELVTDASYLTVDSKIIIAASEFNYALSTTQNNNNRAQASVTKSEDKSTITDPGNDVQIITICEGATEETVAFAVGQKYLYASLTGNHLRTTETLNENASWNITISESGVATIKADVTGQNWLRYNSTNNPPIFSCYASGQTDISIYKLQGSGLEPLPKLVAPVVTAGLNDDETGINVSWNVVENATSYVISGVNEDVTTNKTSYEFSDLKPGTYTISVKAVAEGYISAKGQAAAVTVPSAEGDGGQIKYTLLFGKDYNSNGVSSYTSEWTANNNGFTCKLVNWNNNNNGWNYIKAGRKNNASVATITTSNVVSEALTTVTMTVDAVTTNKINSLKLYVSTDSSFSNKDTYTSDVAKGDVVFNISKPIANAYYKIEVDCASGTSNGLITVSKIVYAN